MNYDYVAVKHDCRIHNTDTVKNNIVFSSHYYCRQTFLDRALQSRSAYRIRMLPFRESDYVLRGGRYATIR